MTDARSLHRATYRLGWLLSLGLLVAGCGRTLPSEEVALAYGRAVYANDADAIWDLVSAADRRVKDQATFRYQQRELRGFVRAVMHQLAGFVAATPVKTTINGDRASTVLRFRLPDANAPPLPELLHELDRLVPLDEGERLPSLKRGQALSDPRPLYALGRMSSLACHCCPSLLTKTTLSVSAPATFSGNRMIGFGLKADVNRNSLIR